MGLFKKKSGKTGKVTELMALRTELDELRARLEATEWAKNITDSRLSALDATTSVLANSANGLAEPAPDLAPRLSELEALISIVQTRLDSTTMLPNTTATPVESAPDLTPRLAELEALISSVQARLDAPPSSTLNITPLPVSPAMPAENQLDAETVERLEALAQRMNAIDELHGQMGQLAERVTASDHTARQAAEQVNAIDQRLSNIGTELANQISELGTDIDALANQPRADASEGGPAVSDEVIEALRDGQVRLANEQARYEIAFRQDLAALAEQVRRPAAR